MFNSETVNSSGVSFLEDNQLFDGLVPIDIDQHIYQNLREALTKPATDLANPQNYLQYLSSHFSQETQRGIPIPQKAKIQLAMAELGINEDKTRIIPSHDFASVLRYTNHLLSQGHREVWWGTADINDFSDPPGKRNINPPLYRNIRSLNDIILNIACAYDFARLHPHSYLKVFPQDGPNPAIGSLLLADSRKGGQWMHLKIRPGEYTTSERKSGDDQPITISIDYSHDLPRIITNQSTPKTLFWLKILTNSQDKFAKLDELKLRGSDYLNPEFIVFLNGENISINFFTDIIWGSSVPQLKKKLCPPTSAPIALVKRAIDLGQCLIIPEKHTDILTSSNKHQWAVLDVLRSTRTRQSDRQTAVLLLQLQTLPEFNFLPRLSFRTLKQLNSVIRGQRAFEIDESLDDLQNSLFLPELFRQSPHVTTPLVTAILGVWRKLITPSPKI